MDETTKQLKAISDIRNMMERSSKFISLSGLSGILAGIYGLIGAATAWYFIRYKIYHIQILGYDLFINEILWLIALLVLGASLISGLLLTIRQSKRKGQLIWDVSARRLLYNLALPLIAGGVFCLAVLQHHIYWIVAPATLIFYGIALINASKFTLHDIHYLGICETVLGMIALFFPRYELLFWAIGFGVLHIVYGTLMYFKYDNTHITSNKTVDNEEIDSE